MNIQAPEASTLDLIAAVSSELTPTERRIAEAVLAEPTLLAFGTVSDLADCVGTSRPSIVRFANKLGFQGYTPLQEHVRSDLSQQLSRPSERIRRDDKGGQKKSGFFLVRRLRQVRTHFTVACPWCDPGCGRSKNTRLVPI
jgi:DNA-binding MurR/RpiR family transcriptional regulator